MCPTNQAIAVNLRNRSIKLSKKEIDIPSYSNEDKNNFIGFMKSEVDSEICRSYKKCYPVQWFDRQLVFAFDNGGFDWGDSGASIMDGEGKALGILHAKWVTPYKIYAIASPYFAVLEALNVKIYSSPNSTEYVTKNSVAASLWAILEILEIV
ncbi:hypothetical protein C1645_763191 [Glomus cerebriforme]|uniref:Uncharacterized protein n=1 Tax=Glomus cerebriforme TaxID=658196 RepID=A0A397T469_9GLOM|nr:hypothetical protein C1645_763191 [Glomus cerebriforme]